MFQYSYPLSPTPRRRPSVSDNLSIYLPMQLIIPSFLSIISLWIMSRFVTKIFPSLFSTDSCTETAVECVRVPVHTLFAAEKTEKLPPLWERQSFRDELSTRGKAFNFLPSAQMGNLSTQIHPIFNDLKDQPGFESALCLASRYLQERCILPFWHALLFEKREFLPDISTINSQCPPRPSPEK